MRVRLEDFVVFGVFIWWFLQVVRRKVHWRTPLTLFIGLYLLVGLFSNILGVYLTKSIPAEMLHFGKSTLHWLRHIEYFSLFFIAYAAVKTRKQALLFITTLALTAIAVVIYGFGQKYYFWPVYSTMNREFSKGIRLYLGEFARVQSTFAGHYDLGAYMALFLPLFLSLYYGFGEKIQLDTQPLAERWRKAYRWLFFLAWLSGLWILVLSASRSSFIGYVIGVVVVFTFFLWRRSFWWVASRSITIGVVSLIMFFLVGDLSSRFAQLIDQNKYPQIYEAYHAANDYRKHPGKLIGLATGERRPPAGSKSVEELEKELNAQGLTSSDTQPTTDKPSDVQVDVPEQVFDPNDPLATLAGNLVEKDGQLVKERTYSDCSLERSLSLCIRLETLWPRAINGFLRNPIFGSGYATLTKESVSQFTEAESTDNNYLRTLGENGALGFFFYYGVFGIALYYLWRAYQKTREPFLMTLAIGVFGGIVALMVNGLYIDVFVASKVAYSLWLIVGIALGVFVKEGLIAPRFAFEKQAQKKDVQQLSALLQKVESQAAERTEITGGYISKHKRALKSTRRQSKKQKRS